MGAGWEPVTTVRVLAIAKGPVHHVRVACSGLHSRETAMTFTRTQGSRSVGDHFEPDAALTPEQQRLMRGHLERIDLAAYTANRTCLAAQPAITLSDFEHLAAAAAHARMSWIRQSLA